MTQSNDPLLDTTTLEAAYRDNVTDLMDRVLRGEDVTTEEYAQIIEHLRVRRSTMQQDAATARKARTKAMNKVFPPSENDPLPVL